MDDHTVQDGWQDFLRRLRRLWGQLREELPRPLMPGPLANTLAIEHAGRLDVWDDEGGASARSKDGA